MDNYTNLKESMNENNTADRPVYYCGVCGKRYYTLEERNICESKCIKERHEAEVKLKEQKLAEEKQKRKDEIMEMYKNLKKLVNEYVKDYGSINLTDSYMDNNFPSMSKLFGSWWF